MRLEEYARDVAGLEGEELERVLRRAEWRRRRGVKECARCREDRPVSAFGFHAYRRDGLHNVCKECRRSPR